MLANQGSFQLYEEEEFFEKLYLHSHPFSKECVYDPNRLKSVETLLLTVFVDLYGVILGLIDHQNKLYYLCE